MIGCDYHQPSNEYVTYLTNEGEMKKSVRRLQKKNAEYVHDGKIASCMASAQTAASVAASEISPYKGVKKTKDLHFKRIAGSTQLDVISSKSIR